MCAHDSFLPYPTNLILFGLELRCEVAADLELYILRFERDRESVVGKNSINDMPSKIRVEEGLRIVLKEVNEILDELVNICSLHIRPNVEASRGQKK